MKIRNILYFMEKKNRTVFQSEIYIKNKNNNKETSNKSFIKNKSTNNIHNIKNVITKRYYYNKEFHLLKCNNIHQEIFSNEERNDNNKYESCYIEENKINTYTSGRM